jgi:DUF1365 family protein
MNSCLYFGEVSHHRKSPKKHDLRYDIYMAHLFLDELDDVFKGRWFWSANRSNLGVFRRSDYHRPEVEDLSNSVRETMSEQLGRECTGPVSIITHLRTFGYCFNPVSFYFLWNEEKTQPVALMAEITNTPWGERYAKCFEWKSGDKDARSDYEFHKEFHVSPFIGMDVEYDWRFRQPTENFQADMILREKGKLFFTAHLKMKRRPIDAKNLAWTLIRFPLMTLNVTRAIYWNALLLRLKGCPFFSHPKNLENPT